jgi:hypothetical protein
MELTSKSEWFVLNSPVGEPDVNWKGKEYHIERIEKGDGEVIWFGCGTNWVKKRGEKWVRLACGNDNTNVDGAVHRDGAVFIPCGIPIYEILYDQIKEGKLRKQNP